MPKYNLVVKYTDGVKQNVLWNELYRTEKPDSNSLKEIDLFTSTLFNDKYELADFLELFQIIEKRDIKKTIRIEYKNSGLLREAQIIYKDDLWFFDVNNLTNYMLSKYNDVKFLEYIVTSFGDNPIQSKNIYTFQLYIAKFRGGVYENYNYKPDVDEENNKKALLDFVYRQIYKYDNTKKSYIYDEDGTPIYNYKQYRDFAKIISNYSKKNDLEEQRQEIISYDNKDSNIKKILKR